MSDQKPSEPWRGSRSDGKRWRGVSAELQERAQQLRLNMTTSETLLWEQLRLRRLDGLRFRRQYPLETFILDFYCPEHRLVVEVDGSIHNLPDVAAHDAERQAYLELKGFRVLRFTNTEVQEDLPSVLARIRQSVAPYPPQAGELIQSLEVDREVRDVPHAGVQVPSPPQAGELR
ncbi:MAG: endonuclease domain-containing protein [Capsulimonadales bacterium]|nr:endonuclease domain-containing protein [Capsulimonadales bacterium]